MSQLFTEPGTHRSATKFRKCTTCACDTVRTIFSLEPCMRRHEVSRAHKTLMPKVTVICNTRSQPRGFGHRPRGSRMQQRNHINITRPLKTTHDRSTSAKPELGGGGRTLLTHSLAHSLTHKLSLAHSLSLTHSLTDSHSLTHSLTH